MVFEYSTSSAVQVRVPWYGIRVLRSRTWYRTCTMYSHSYLESKQQGMQLTSTGVHRTATACVNRSCRSVCTVPRPNEYSVARAAKKIRVTIHFTAVPPPFLLLQSRYACCGSGCRGICLDTDPQSFGEMHLANEPHCAKQTSRTLCMSTSR